MGDATLPTSGLWLPDAELGGNKCLILPLPVCDVHNVDLCAPAAATDSSGPTAPWWHWRKLEARSMEAGPYQVLAHGHRHLSPRFFCPFQTSFLSFSTQTGGHYMSCLLLPESPHSPVFALDYLARMEGAVPQPGLRHWKPVWPS